MWTYSQFTSFGSDFQCEYSCSHIKSHFEEHCRFYVNYTAFLNDPLQQNVFYSFV